MASESNAALPDPAAAPLPPGYAPGPPAHLGFTSAPVGWVIAGMLVFWPTGIPALLASHRAARAFGAADVETAQRESASARRWGITSVIVGACLVALSVLLWFVAVAFFVFVAHQVDEGVWQETDGWSTTQPHLEGPGQPPHAYRNG